MRPFRGREQFVVEMVAVLITAGSGILLVALVLVVRRRAVRFIRARDALRLRVAQGGAALREARRLRAGSSG